MIEITPAAAEKIKEALINAPEPGLALRVAARRGDDGGTEFGMGLDERRDQDEEIVTDAGITLLVAPPSLEAVNGTVIDFVEVTPGELNFIFYRAGDLPDDAAPTSDGGGSCDCGKGGCG